MVLSYIKLILGLVLLIQLQPEQINCAKTKQLRDQITNKQSCLQKLSNHLASDIDNGLKDCKKHSNSVAALNKLIKLSGAKCLKSSKGNQKKVRRCLANLERQVLAKSITLMVRWKLCVVKTDPQCSPDSKKVPEEPEDNTEEVDNDIPIDETDGELIEEDGDPIDVDQNENPDDETDIPDDEENSQNSNDEEPEDNTDVQIIEITEKPDEVDTPDKNDGDGKIKEPDDVIDTETTDHIVNGVLVGQTVKEIQKSLNDEDVLLTQIDYNVDTNGKKTLIPKDNNNKIKWWTSKDPPNWLTFDGKNKKGVTKKVIRKHKINGKLVGDTEEKIRIQPDGKEVVEDQNDYNIDKTGKRTPAKKNGKKNWELHKKKQDKETVQIVIEENYVGDKLVGVSQKKIKKSRKNKKKTVEKLHFNVDSNGNKSRVHKKEKKNWIDPKGKDMSTRKVIIVKHKINGKVVGKTVTKLDRQNKNVRPEIIEYNIDDNGNDTEIPKGGKKNWKKPKPEKKPEEPSNDWDVSWDSKQKTKTDKNGKTTLTITRNYKRQGKPIGKTIEEYEILPNNSRKLLKLRNVNIDADGKETDVKPDEQKNWETPTETDTTFGTNSKSNKDKRIPVHTKIVIHNKNGVLVGKTITKTYKDLDGKEQTEVKDYNIDKAGNEQEVQPGQKTNWRKKVDNDNSNNVPADNAGGFNYQQTIIHKKNGVIVGKTVQTITKKPDGSQTTDVKDYNVGKDGTEEEVKPGGKKNWESDTDDVDSTTNKRKKTSVRTKTVNHKRNGILIGKTVTKTYRGSDGKEESEVVDYNVDKDGNEEVIQPDGNKNWEKKTPSKTNNGYSLDDSSGSSTSQKTTIHKKNGVIVGKTVYTTITDPNGTVKSEVKEYNIEKDGKEVEIKSGGKKNWEKSATDDDNGISTHVDVVIHKKSGVVVGKTVTTVITDANGEEQTETKDYNIDKNNKEVEALPEDPKNWIVAIGNKDKSASNPNDFEDVYESIDYNKDGTKNVTTTENHKVNGKLIGKTVKKFKEDKKQQRTLLETKDYKIDDKGKEVEYKAGEQRLWVPVVKSGGGGGGGGGGGRGKFKWWWPPSWKHGRK